MPRTYTEKQYQSQVRKAKAGWGRYFAELENNQERDIHYYEQVEQLPVNDMTEYAQEQIRELLIKLKTTIDCPVCLETIAPDQIEMTACGHKFCKQCIKAIKSAPEPKCAICRGKIWVKK
mgnify:FL=1